MELPRLGAELELQLLAYITAIATQDPSRICNLHHSSRQCRGRRHGLDPVLLWLWRRPAAVAPIQPLAWELLNAVGAALQNKQNKTKSNLK